MTYYAIIEINTPAIGQGESITQKLVQAVTTLPDMDLLAVGVIPDFDPDAPAIAGALETVRQRFEPTYLN